jgi:hypothetical protein
MNNFEAANYKRELAKAGYAAYCKKAGGLTFDGKPLPTFDELGEERQDCWIACVNQVIAQAITPLFGPPRMQNEAELINNHSGQAQPAPKGCITVYSFKRIPADTRIGFDEPGERA